MRDIIFTVLSNFVGGGGVHMCVHVCLCDGESTEGGGGCPGLKM